ncbi:hypothetical protein DFH06DRAFT_1410414 [Mycena polygramma]|nr:hypothetical protein DFH06DRAFT_1410414 [Mycena polygramma]
MRTTSSMHLPEGQAPWKAVVQNEQKKIGRWRGRDSPMTLSALGACARSERRTKEYKKGARRMKSRRRGIGATLKAKRLASTKLPKRNSLGVANPRYTREATIEEEREEKSIQEKKLTPNPSQRNRKQTLPRAQPFVPPRGHHFFLVVVFAVSEKGEEALVIWKGKREAEGGRREGEGRGERGREGAGRERGGGKGVGGGEGGGERTIRLKGRKGDSNETTRRKEERKTRQSRAGEVKGNAASIAAEGDMSGNNEDEVKRKADHISRRRYGGEKKGGDSARKARNARGGRIRGMRKGRLARTDEGGGGRRCVEGRRRTQREERKERSVRKKRTTIITRITPITRMTPRLRVPRLPYPLPLPLALLVLGNTQETGRAAAPGCRRGGGGCGIGGMCEAADGGRSTESDLDRSRCAGD